MATTRDFPPRRLTRRHFAKTVIAVPAFLAYGCRDRAVDDPDMPAADALAPGAGSWPEYDDAIVIDCLASPGPFNVQDRIGQPLTDEMVRNATASGITAVNVTVSGGGDDPEAAYAATLVHLDYWRREALAHPEVLTIASSTAEIEAAKAAGKLALIMGFQDTVMLGTDLARMDEFHEMGVKVVQLTYNVPNLVGEGCLSPGNGGLTDFGLELVAHMSARRVSWWTCRTAASAPPPRRSKPRRDRWRSPIPGVPRCTNTPAANRTPNSAQWLKRAACWAST